MTTPQERAARINELTQELCREIVAVVMEVSPPGASPASLIANICMNLLSVIGTMSKSMTRYIEEGCEKCGILESYILPKSQEQEVK